MSLVTVVIPAFNAERWVAATIQSALGQSHRDVELVVVDDGSTDGTARVVEQCGDDRVSLLRQPNGGLAAARNAGLAQARGEFIMFLDADDLLQPVMIERCLAKMLERADNAVISTDWRYIDGSGSLLPNRSYFRPIVGDALPALAYDNPFVVHGMLTRRACFEACGPFGAFYGNEDWAKWLDIARAGFRFDCVEEPLVLYRKHDSNMTYNILKMAQGQKAVLDYLSSHTEPRPEINEIVRRAYGRVYRQLTYGFLRARDIENALASFRRSFEHDPALLDRPETYFDIVAAALNWQFEHYLDDRSAVLVEQALLALLNDLPEQGGGGSDRRFVARRRSLAYGALAQLAYAHGVSPGLTRRFEWTSLMGAPDRYTNRVQLAWLARSMVGKPAVTWFKERLPASRGRLQPSGQ